ncbi:hypothetical protein PGT21_035906 [Puccinia graminis f. sp. tritici]|uniref:Uncharacterized protein n=1 Tax=Puccinia graminis f. sp. tritici TaxID=56615 RepID=A0A5B0QPY6_PUCGR|nr:hypothetical protein PGT21_035906 [Puccinia graminis f. sp. tritici]
MWTPQAWLAILLLLFLNVVTPGSAISVVCPECHGQVSTDTLECRQHPLASKILQFITGTCRDPSAVCETHAYLYKNTCPHCGLTYWLTMNPCPLHHYPRQLDDNEFGKEDEL